jgi:hypothetical protein
MSAVKQVDMRGEDAHMALIESSLRVPTPPETYREHLRWVDETWLSHVAEYNLERSTSCYSRSDVLFMLRCSLWVRLNPPAQPRRDEFSVLAFRELFAEMAVMSASHERALRCGAFPSQEASTSLFSRVAAFLCEYFLPEGPFGLEERVRLLPEYPPMHTLDEAYFTLVFEYKPSEEELAKQKEAAELLESRKTLSRYVSYAPFQSDQERRAEEEAELRQRAKPATKGGQWLWPLQRASAEGGGGPDAVREAEKALERLVPLAARLFAQIEVERSLEAGVVSRVAVDRVSDEAHAKFAAWLKETCSFDYSVTDLPNKLRNLVGEFLLPKGCRYSLKRNERTCNENPDSISLLSSEVGAGLTRWVMKAFNSRENSFEAIAADPQHGAHELLILCMVNNMFFERLKTPLMGSCILLPSQLTYASFRERQFNRQKRRPRMTYLCGAWSIHHWLGREGDGVLFVCPDVTTMLYKWFSLVLHDCGGKLDNRANVNCAWAKEIFSLT